MRRAFEGCENLTIADDAGVPNLSGVKSMFLMFFGSNFNGDLSKWDVSSVTNMQSMFRETSFNGDLSKWDVSSVTDMGAMFGDSSFNGDLSKWDVGNVTNMTSMFFDSDFNGDLSNWDVGNVTNMSSMFRATSFNGDISAWNVSSVTNMSSMFSGEFIINRGLTKRHPFNQDLSNWDVSKVTDMANMFRGSDFNQDLSKWDVSSVTDMSYMFSRSTFNGDISKWNVSSVTNMNFMFFGHTFTRTAFNGDISKWNVSKVTSMRGMFWNSSFNGDISKWDISNVRDMGRMLTRSLMSSENYDKLLNGWSTLDTGAGETEIPPSISSFLADPLRYSCAGVDARNKLINDYSWGITGDELIPLKTDAVSLPALPSQCTLARDDVTTPTAKNSCTEGSGETVMATTNAAFPITTSTMITWTYTHEGKSITQKQAVTITPDNTPPTVTTLDPITARCSLEQAALTIPKAADNCDDGEIIGTHNVSNFPITSNTSITWTYEDNAGNTTTQTQQVTIADTTDPVPDVSDLMEITGACPFTATDLTAPTATDNCDDGKITATTDSFPITASGVITWTYTDKAGNTVTQTQQVTCPLSAAEDAVEAVVFPNPSGRYVEVRSPVESPVRILSVGGELVLETITNTRIDAASLQSGLYLVQLPDGHLLKFIKK
ncbi:MAG: BspA family leucine-rich repeat surface protein [Ekhidna sp.]|nr:BspA family leucine-rich repeat surface protein [Ekhidna sp.]MBC6409740.1 BspA family leucine-rich repeat surface protein [Ekhidna sp.]